MYWGFILIAMAIIWSVDYFLLESIFAFSWWYAMLGVVLSVVCVFIIDAFTAFIVRWVLPEKMFNEKKTWFCGSKKEVRFYEKLGIKKWKDKIPELGKFTDFRKNKILDPKNNEYVAKYIVEANYGVLVHITGIVFGFLIIFIFPLKYFCCFGLPVGIINGVYNALSLFILRYNLPKLHTLYKINERRAVAGR